MKKLIGVFFAVIVAALFAGAAFAGDTQTASQGSDPGHQSGPMDKAGRGLTNAAFGWTEIPKRIVDKTRETKNPFTGLVLGSWQGSCNAFARTASGAAELVTFPIGRYDKPRVLPDTPASEK